MEKVSLGSLTSILRDNLCEIFIKHRRLPLANRPIFRRMLCTNSNEILRTFHGISRLGFRAPTKPPPFNASALNLIITWDILMKDHRCINLDDTFLIQKYPINERNTRLWMRGKDYFVHPISNLPIKVNPKDNFMGGLNFIRKYILDTTYLTLSQSESYYWMDRE